MIRIWTGLLCAVVAASGFAAEVPIPAPPQIGASSFLLMDFSSNHVLVNKT